MNLANFYPSGVNRKIVLRLLLLLLVAMFIVTPAVGQNGRTGVFGFLQLDPSARGAALAGGLGATYDGDPASFYYNPALLNSKMHGALSLSYQNHLSDINASSVSYVRHYDSLKTTFAAGVRFLSYGSFEEADENGHKTGDTFGATGTSISFAAGRQWTTNLYLGLALNTSFARLSDARATAFSFDAGIVWNLPTKGYVFSLAVLNAGFVASNIGQTDDKLPLDVRIAVSKKLTHLPLRFSLTFWQLQDWSETKNETFGSAALQHVIFGAEFQFGKTVNVRFGYNHRVHENLKVNSRLDLAGLALGFGIQIKRFKFDYAFNSWSSNGGIHQLSIQTKI